jgi:hypothetical protein
MCIRHHTHWSVESVAERGDVVQQPLHCLQCVEEVVRVSKPEQRSCLPRASRIRGHRSRWSEACSSETSTAQYIIYNIKKWGCLIELVVQRKPTLLTCPDAFSSPPPPRPEKTIHNLPKTPSHQTSSSPMRCPRDRFPEQSPSTNEPRGPRRGFVPGTNKRSRVSTVKTRISSLLPSRDTTTKHFPHQTQPDVCPCNGPGLPAHPPQSGGQPPHVPLLPRTGVTFRGGAWCGCCSRAVAGGLEMRALDGVSTQSLAGFGCESFA